ncbi:hypothetical protein HPB48_010222 [Haemaphysalis longicornis]|uniref:Uncharacterized protein n=1 Tax=Haemaphysalis longicornis TaxID=44386 RepID=A0A9J6GK74_HAELO|nr:hypothetical protein HPB48_010222 [Haemaphysalis longicornis]
MKYKVGKKNGLYPYVILTKERTWLWNKQEYHNLEVKMVTVDKELNLTGNNYGAQIAKVRTADAREVPTQANTESRNSRIVTRNIERCCFDRRHQIRLGDVVSTTITKTRNIVEAKKTVVAPVMTSSTTKQPHHADTD